MIIHDFRDRAMKYAKFSNDSFGGGGTPNSNPVADDLVPTPIVNIRKSGPVFFTTYVTKQYKP